MNAYIKDDHVVPSGVRLISGGYQASKLAMYLLPHLDNGLFSIDQVILDENVLKFVSGFGLFKKETYEAPKHENLSIEFSIEGVNTCTPLYDLKIASPTKTLLEVISRDFTTIDKVLKKLSNEGISTNSKDVKLTLVDWLEPAPLEIQKTLLHLLKEGIPLLASFEEANQVKVTFL